MRTTSVAVMVIFFGSVFPKLLDHSYVQILSQQLRGTLTAAFEIHLTIEDFMVMDQHLCQTCTKPFDLLLYASLSLKQA